jgi:hypothetical protein
VRYMVLMYSDPQETRAMSASDGEAVQGRHEAVHAEESGAMLNGAVLPGEIAAGLLQHSTAPALPAAYLCRAGRPARLTRRDRGRRSSGCPAGPSGRLVQCCRGPGCRGPAGCRPRWGPPAKGVRA